ncbi:solute carrier family 35 member f6-like [Plakobranchus ocellatus]|uniref:Solute carrier family 35 member f6-like n=1 Tax=Plakobranchus ocellatus TaxID=259542 RepID=A0AAV4APL5_9GAST|nr:solute carrier family 35 member f6-like [Plakobranchus ocellatus]
MAPSSKDIFRGMAFVFVGVLKALCDRWPLKIDVQGRKERHKFDHMLVLMFVEQFFQMGLLLFYYAIEKNWLGCQRFSHGEIAHRDNPNPTLDQTAAHMGHMGEPEPMLVNADEDNGGEVDAQEEAELELRRKRRQRYRKLVYLFPAVFYVLQALMLHFGLDITYSSSFIMLKGTIMIFVALFVIAFLAQQLPGYVWVGIFGSCAGFAVSGISDYVDLRKGNVFEKYGVVTGNLLIVMSQIFLASKLVYEEKFLHKHWIHPMKFLGAEGVYGFVMTGIILLVFCVVPVSDFYSYVVPKTNRLEDVVDAVIQLGNSKTIIAAFVCSILLHILWNYLGLFMVRDHGALHRVMVEMLVWMFYWAICLILKWENFFVGQVPALCAIAVGILVYANILPLCSFCGQRVANINQAGIFLNRGQHYYDQPYDGDEEDGQDGDDRNRHANGGNDNGNADNNPAPDHDGGNNAIANESSEDEDDDKRDGPGEVAANASSNGDDEILSVGSDSEAAGLRPDDDHMISINGDVSGDESDLSDDSGHRQNFAQDVPLLKA